MERLSFEQARTHTQHDMLWCARLRTGDVIWEQPGLSSDGLPADEVVSISYVPVIAGLTTIECHVDLDRGERFVRYWTTIWRQGQGMQRLYVLGVRFGDEHALLGYYTRFDKVVLATTRPFQPPWLPEPFKLLPPDATIIGGPGTPEMSWLLRGFGGVLTAHPGKRIRFRGNH